MKVATVAYWLHAFFHEWLAQQRNLSHHTVLSYRDTERVNDFETADISI